jgi:hypothetical protein
MRGNAAHCFLVLKKCEITSFILEPSSPQPKTPSPLATIHTPSPNRNLGNGDHLPLLPPLASPPLSCLPPFRLPLPDARREEASGLHRRQRRQRRERAAVSAGPGAGGTRCTGARALRYRAKAWRRRSTLLRDSRWAGTRPASPCRR